MRPSPSPGTPIPIALPLEDEEEEEEPELAAWEAADSSSWGSFPKIRVYWLFCSLVSPASTSPCAASLLLLSAGSRLCSRSLYVSWDLIFIPKTTPELTPESWC